ncbi:MAG: DUF1501 domain-containing protein [Rhodovarius sp.]|nr:DUF1501 domain-containing protein [Rhodovarius sp.]MDW8313776.1 DUF1501 domain-containing protein [Rhodovarius sp.]
MTHLPRLARRSFLLGLTAAVTVGRARLAVADAPGEARFIVIILRGALDGLAAVQPYGEAGLHDLRGPLALPEPGQEGGLLDLGGFFGLHPALAHLHAMFAAGEALAIHAVAGHWRSRSHFDAQDFLESGEDRRLDSGWLNRALAALPEGRGEVRQGLAVGVGVPLLLRGPVRVSSYAPPGQPPVPADLLSLLAGLHAQDPLTAAAFREGLRARGFSAAALAGSEPPPGNRNAFAALAGAAGRLLSRPDGPRVAAMELGGWDTHFAQPARLPPVLRELDQGLAALKEALGAAWAHTAVLLATEFGRTVRVNGTQGTDHGTAGVAFVLGGAVAGGRVLGTWPGLSDLFENRDLAPTTDLRAVAKALLAGHLRLPPAAVAQAFPGSEQIAPMQGLLRG